MAYLTIALCLSIVSNVIITILHYREKREVFDRFMAGDYGRYKYHEKVQPVEVENFKKKLEEERRVAVEKTEAQKLREAVAEKY